MDYNIKIDEDTDIFYCENGLCVCCRKKSLNLNLVYVDWLITSNKTSNKPNNPFYSSTIALYLCNRCIHFCPNTTYGHLEHDGLDKIIKKIKNQYISSSL